MSWRNSCHLHRRGNCFFINSNPTLSHGASNFLFQFVSNLDSSLNVTTYTCDWNPFCKSDQHHALNSAQKPTFNIIVVCNFLFLPFACAVVKVAMQTLTAWNRYELQKRISLAVGEKFNAQAFHSMTRRSYGASMASALILISKWHSSYSLLKHYCLSNHNPNDFAGAHRKSLSTT